MTMDPKHAFISPLLLPCRLRGAVHDGPHPEGPRLGSGGHHGGAALHHHQGPHPRDHLLLQGAGQEQEGLWAHVTHRYLQDTQE